ncbi:hypothetical protein OBO34_07335 [Clostridiales Family XIII bacterium ASD5510]|uniref:Uncharacterized protein n=1 Tax=Hominibacterium faecale TaxID=2839743 RepID=A0A9J6QVK3_9FIRM|nr:hypothetical protein [Hominibacterium faecale]MCU7378166.1 hypothetical protein [Hominibacterium faecale]
MGFFKSLFGGKDDPWTRWNDPKFKKSIQKAAAKKEMEKERLATQESKKKEAIEDTNLSMSQGNYNQKPSPPSSKAYTNTYFQNLQTAYYAELEELERKYSVIYNQKIYTGPKVQEFLNLCYSNKAKYEALIPYWQKYNLGVPKNAPSYKRIAMIYEKQEAYGNAVQICAEAIRIGAINDGTKGKMHGRLARLIKKCNHDVDPEIKKLLD